MKRQSGLPVRGSTTGRPVMILLDVLGQRWVLRILWELAQGRSTFRILQQKCDQISPTVLNNRLKELRRLRLIDLYDDGYGLTAQGKSLADHLIPLNQWAHDWASILREDDAEA